MVEVDDLQKQRWRDWERAMDAHNRAFDYHNGAQERFAAGAIKSLELTAAGGIFATLAFYSANFDHLQTVEGSLRTFNTILACLFVALFLALLTSAAAYFSQMAYSESLYKRTFSGEPPFAHNSPATDRLVKWGNRVRWAGIVFAFASLGFLTAAGVQLTGLLQGAPSPTTAPPAVEAPATPAPA